MAVVVILEVVLLLTVLFTLFNTCPYFWILPYTMGGLRHPPDLEGGQPQSVRGGYAAAKHTIPNISEAAPRVRQS